MGRKAKNGKRTKSGQLSRSRDAMFERAPPNDFVMERRRLFAWFRPTKGPDGRVGELDQDICDGIGQLHALGLLEGHGIDGLELRNTGRFYGQHFWTRYRETAPKTGKYERADKCQSGYLGETRDDRRFDRMDELLRGNDRSTLHTLVVDKCWGDEIVCWAQAMIYGALMGRRIFRKAPIIFPTVEDAGRLKDCIRALCTIYDAGLGERWERKAA